MSLKKKEYKIRKYTYLIRTDYYSDEFIDNIFKSRGNWIKVYDRDLPKYKMNAIDFIYLDGLNYLKPQYYSLRSNLKNIVNDGKRVISFKNNLIRNLSQIPDARQFVLPQVEIDLYNYITPSSIDEFDNTYRQLFMAPDKVYIFKPVSGMGGSGIKIFTTYDEFMDYCMEIIKMNSAKWGKRDPNKEPLRMFVLQEYITNPYLVTKDSADYKFHVRHFFIYQPGNTNTNSSYYKKIGKMALAELPYIHGDWYNAKIHDTHFHDYDKWLFTCEDTGISPDNMLSINNQIDKFYKILYKLVKPHAGCYPESKNCFEIFGIDFMITRDYVIKVLEVNAGIGLSANMTANKAELFKGMVELVADKHFPPVQKPIPSLADKFTKITLE